MKKKIYSMLLMISMVCGLCACGASAGEKAATFIIEDETYNLSGDFQEVVGSMVENDLQVRSLYDSMYKTIYDEDGKFSDEEVDMGKPSIYAAENSVLADESIIQKMYKDNNITMQSLTDDRKELIDNLKKENDYLEAFLPNQLTEDELNKFREDNNIDIIATLNPKQMSLIGYSNYDNFEKTFNKTKELLYNPRITEETVQKEQGIIGQEIDMYNMSFGASEKINSFIILDKEWTIDGGELTPSYKIKRDIIAEKYSEQIDLLF